MGSPLNILTRENSPIVFFPFFLYWLPLPLAVLIPPLPQVQWLIYFFWYLGDKQLSDWLNGPGHPWRRRRSHFAFKSLTHRPIKFYYLSSFTLSLAEVWSTFDSIFLYRPCDEDTTGESWVVQFIHQTLPCTLNNCIETWDIFCFYIG